MRSAHIYIQYLKNNDNIRIQTSCEREELNIREKKHKNFFFRKFKNMCDISYVFLMHLK